MQTTKDYHHFTLSTGDGACSLELLPHYGGMINRLDLNVGGDKVRNVIAGFHSEQEILNDSSYGGIPLFPVVNRIDGGHYEHLGKKYQLTVNETALNNALHGFIQHIKPEYTELFTEANRASVELRYHYDGHLPGYPFAAEVRNTYTITSAGELELVFYVKNLHTEVIPVGIGWHPYFQLGGQMDALRMQLPSVQRVHVDERMLPTGAESPFADFATLSLIGQTQLDTCFRINLDRLQPEAVATAILWSDADQFGLELWQETGPNGYNYIQVCIPPNRKSIAIEPVSCGLNAFQTKQGLTMLEPQQELSAKSGVRLIKQIQNPRHPDAKST